MERGERCWEITVATWWRQLDGAPSDSCETLLFIENTLTTITLSKDFQCAETLWVAIERNVSHLEAPEGTRQCHNVSICE